MATWGRGVVTPSGTLGTEGCEPVATRRTAQGAPSVAHKAVGHRPQRWWVWSACVFRESLLTGDLRLASCVRNPTDPRAGPAQEVGAGAGTVCHGTPFRLSQALRPASPWR